MWRRESRSVAIASLALKIADVGAFSPNLVARVPGPLMYPCARNDAVASAWPVGLFGFGSGPSAGDGSVTRARKALEQNGAFNARTDQYLKGAITANDLVRSYEQDVAAKIAGIDLQDVVAAGLEKIPTKRKRDLLSNASEGRAIGVGGQTVAVAARSGGRGDVVINGQQAQYVMQQRVQRVSSGKTTIFDGVEVGKEGTLLKFKSASRSNAASVATEVAILERIRVKSGSGTCSRHFVDYVDYVKDYNGRGDVVMVMRAESMDMRKLAEANGGSLGPGKLRKYASEMFAIVRCLDKAGLVWTDLKLDNLVLCERGEVRAIDLETAVPTKSAPIAFTPSSLPPDFAASRGQFDGITVDRSYHVWGLGMAILHLYMGRGYFQGSTDPQIIAEVSRPGFAVDLSEVKDGRLRGLLQGLLEPDPNKRIRYFDSPTTRLALL